MYAERTTPTSDGFNLRKNESSLQPHQNHQRSMVGGIGFVDDMRFDGFGATVEDGDVVDARCRFVCRVGGLVAREDGEMLFHRLEQL